MKKRYTTTISFNEKEIEQLEKIKKQGITMKGIWQVGCSVLLKKMEENNQNQGG